MAKPRPYWICQRCRFRNERRGNSRKCQSCGSPVGRRLKHVPPHEVALRDNTYAAYAQVNAAIHGITDESCACCGRERVFPGRHERDHGHRTGELSYGKPRGLLCTRCNRIVVGQQTLEEHRQAVAYIERVEAYYAKEAAA